MKLNLLLKSIGIMLFVIILSRLDFAALGKSFSGFRAEYFAPAVMITFITAYFQSLRWRVLLLNAGFRLPAGKCFAIYLATCFIGSLTPGKLGEFSRVFYLKKYDVPFERAFVTVLFDRLYDVAFTLLFGLLSLIYVINYKNAEIAHALIIILIIVSLIIALRKYIMYFLKVAAKFITPSRFRESAVETVKYIPSFFSGINLSNHISLIGLSIAAWIVHFVRMYMLALSVNLNIPILYLCACIIAAALVMLIPITIQGIGTRDAALIGMFYLVGASSEAAVSYSLVILCASVIFQLLCSIAFLFVPLKIGNHAENPAS